MGLLSDDKTRAKIVNGIKKYNNVLAILCYVVGLVWFLCLAYAPLNAKTYFSENALIPGLVEPTFYNDHGAENYYNELKEEFRVRKEIVDKLASSGRKSDDSLLYTIPADWIQSKMQSVGLETYVHNFSFTYPMEIAQGQKFYGHNVYGILRGSKTASTEAVVLTVPFRSMHTDGEKTAAGIALMLGLAKAFRSKTYWAKDIVFLVTEHEGVGMSAWLAAYHYSEVPCIFPSELPARSGSIQAAINLELGNNQISRVNIKMEGVNGQLPNLDLINTVVRICKQHGILPVINKRRDSNTLNEMDNWRHSINTMMLMMLNQASGFATGNHGLFHRYNIEAVTLQGIKVKNAKKNVGFPEIGRLIEGVFRSLNNLMERFHQSFFFYLLPATERYVSIGLYMPPFGLLALPIVIKALALWIEYSYDCHKVEKIKEKQEKSGSEDDSLNKPSGQGGFMSVIPSIVMSFVFGFFIYVAPPFLITSALVVKMTPGDGLAMGVLAIFIAALSYPKLLSRKANKRKLIEGPNWKLLKALCLLSLGIILGAVSVFNISLAFFITAFWAPVLTNVRPRESMIATVLQSLLLILVSPLALIYYSATVQLYIHNSALFSGDHTLLGVGEKIWENVQHGFLMAVVDSYLYNHLLHAMVAVLFWPIWLLFWAVCMASVQKPIPEV